MEGILHINLFEYLIKKDNAFGYVQIKDFLLENIPELENQNDRLRMKRFLDFMESENYIEKRDGEQRGIWITQKAGRIIPRNEISSVVRIKPKAVDSFNSYLNNKANRKGMYLSIIIAITALFVSGLSLISYDNMDNKKIYLLDDKVDFLYKEIDKLKSRNSHLIYDLDSIQKHNTRKEAL